MLNTYIAGKINQRLGLLKRIKPFSARLLFCNSLVIPLFDYADVVWGDKHNVTLMSSLQILQNKAKTILHRPLYSPATQALANLKPGSISKKLFSKEMYLCV